VVGVGESIGAVKSPIWGETREKSQRRVDIVGNSSKDGRIGDSNH